MENSLLGKLLNEDEMRLERDFCAALSNFGLDPKHIDRYQAQEVVNF